MYPNTSTELFIKFSTNNNRVKFSRQKFYLPSEQFCMFIAEINFGNFVKLKILDK